MVRNDKPERRNLITEEADGAHPPSSDQKCLTCLPRLLSRHASTMHATARATGSGLPSSHALVLRPRHKPEEGRRRVGESGCPMRPSTRSPNQGTNSEGMSPRDVVCNANLLPTISHPSWPCCPPRLCPYMGKHVLMTTTSICRLGQGPPTSLGSLGKYHFGDLIPHARSRMFRARQSLYMARARGASTAMSAGSAAAMGFNDDVGGDELWAI